MDIRYIPSASISGPVAEIIRLPFVGLECPGGGAGVPAVDEELHRTDPEPLVAVTRLSAEPGQRLDRPFGGPSDPHLHRGARQLTLELGVDVLPGGEPAFPYPSLDEAGDAKTEELPQILYKADAQLSRCRVRYQAADQALRALAQDAVHPTLVVELDDGAGRHLGVRCETGGFERPGVRDRAVSTRARQHHRIHRRRVIQIPAQGTT